MKTLITSLILLLSLSSYAQNNATDPETVTGDLPEDSGSFENGSGSNDPGNGDSEYNTNIRMRNPRSRGGGCNDGEISATLSPDKKNLSVLFDNFIVQAGGSTNKARDTKICSLTIPFEVPAGFRVSVVKLDYRGFNQLPNRGGSRLFTSYHFVNATTQKPYGTRVSRNITFVGPVDNEYVVSSSLRQRPVWSECGKSFNLNIDAKIMTATNPNREDAMTTIDSLDVSAEDSVQYALLWRSCNDTGNDPRAREREEREKQRERRDNKPVCRTPNCRK